MESSINQTIKSNLRKLLKANGETANSLHQKLGIPQKTLNNHINADTPVSVETIDAMVRFFQVSADSIMGYETPALVKAVAPRSLRPSIDVLATPIYNVKESQSLHDMCVESNIAGYLKVPNAADYDGAVYVRGDGMKPFLNPGSLVAFKLLRSFSFIIPGNVYIVDVSLDGDSYQLVRYVSTEDPNTFKLTDCAGSFMIVDKSAVRSMALVKLTINYLN